MYALQNQNVERKIAKQIDIKKLNQVSQTSLETNIEIIEKNFDSTNIETNLNQETTVDTTPIQNID